GDERRALMEYRELEKLGQRAGVAVIQRDSRQLRIHPELEEEIGLELLPEYDFDSFVVGARNKFAHATAKAVADHPGSARNPLFLYSGVGLGKTHLMHAIANQMIKNNARCRIVYTSTEYFTTALEHARDKNLLSEFRGRHRGTDILLLDDIQFLAGREESQEEFFHIFNMLHQARKQIVVTSDRPPKDIARLDMRLRTRFGQGVIVDIQSPDLETRLVILRAEAQRRAFNVPEDALAVIANKITTNVRELKGAFNLFLEHHEIGGEALDSKTAKDIVDKYYTA
ncbi:MAG: chromosomal replication initiator protein DnaA, partial [Candidatus Sumerlaeota bacterium]